MWENTGNNCYSPHQKKMNMVRSVHKHHFTLVHDSMSGSNIMPHFKINHILKSITYIVLLCNEDYKKGTYTGLQIRVHIGKLLSLFQIQNICFGYSKAPSQ